jgi:hypothetical protein
MIEVKSANYITDYKLFIEFSNGIKGTVDLKDALWSEIFEPLIDINLFKNFIISEITNTIEWYNGADLAPEFLYDKLII